MTKMVKRVSDDAIASNLVAIISTALQVDYGAAARTAAQNEHQELATKEE